MTHLFSIEMRQNLAASKDYRVCGYYCVCALCPILVTSFFMIYFWNLTRIAGQYNVMRPQLADSSVVTPFNLCDKNPNESPEPYQSKPQKLNTRWNDIFILNALVYTLLTIWQILLVFSSFAWQLAYVGACCIGCAQMCQFASIIVVGIFRYNSLGSDCSQSQSLVLDDGTTFAEIGSQIENIFIAQCIIYWALGCCFIVLVKLAIGVAKLKKS